MVKHIAPGWLNVHWRRVGGLTFIKIGRITLSFSVSRTYKPLAGA